MCTTNYFMFLSMVSMRRLATGLTVEARRVVKSSVTTSGTDSIRKVMLKVIVGFTSRPTVLKVCTADS